MRREGVALVVSAPSGAGKTTLIRRLLGEFSTFSYSVSCTTRRPRAGEIDGKDYSFLSREEFEHRKAEGFFAEWAEVYGNLYGTPLEPVWGMLRQGSDMLFDIDVQGAAQIKLSLDGAAVFVFVLPPSMEELERRLRGRGQDDETVIQRRLESARREMTEAGWYDALIVNDTLERAYDALRSVYLSATLAPARNPGLRACLSA
ncbi:MAG: guanylate kinase [Candidatus Desulfovibrio kirbyi]|jgi:guanylate kinase|uniref:Guanylate kinase n=1 Tax=Candidatus Desulfovibrio kirbyi TaxID=2696086 RepID=A0A6L2R422_9BACT|nr:guanylate kinase [Desulfovibrio sp.]GFH62331.1 MAG: guanylate kinase [Candidatus Desulfovibrio kirbyi]